jgi:predicted O-methyltransferase YrrM
VLEEIPMSLESRPLDPNASRASAMKRQMIRAGRWLYYRAFPVAQAAGIHIVPNHFYGPIPDTRDLIGALWERPSEAVGIDMRPDGQLKLLDEISAFRDEYDRFPAHSTGVPHEYHHVNGKFGSIDGGMYYGLLRLLKPGRILEVGSGYSTMLAAQAIAVNERETGEATELTVIDPFPHAAVAAGFSHLSRTIASKVQDVPMDEFTRLEAGDILFIDTSHVVRIGGDVQFEFLEVLPRLQKGVIVHIHDIYLPAEYPKEWVLDGLTFWSEQYILQAFLAFNSAFEVILGGQYLHLYHPEALKRTFQLYDGDPMIGSFWIRRAS